MKELIRHIIKEEVNRQDKVISLINQFGLSKTANAVGGYKKLVNILKGTNFFNVTVSIKPKYIYEYLKGDRRYRGKVSYYEAIVKDDWALWSDWGDYDTEELIGDLDEENLEDVRKILSKQQGEDLSDVSIDELLEYDESGNIGEVIQNAASNVDRIAYGDYLQKQLIKAFEEYGGKVIEFDDENIKFTADLGRFIVDIEEHMEHIPQNMEYDIESCMDASGSGDELIYCLFNDFVANGWIKKPEPNFNDGWYNDDFNVEFFNEIIADNLYEYLN